MRGALRVVGNVTTQLLVPLADAADTNLDTTVRGIRAAIAGSMQCLPQSFPAVIGDLWGLERIREPNCWLPMFSVHPSEEDDSHRIAGSPVTEVWSRRRKSPKCEIMVVPGAGEVSVEAAWTALHATEIARFRNALAAFHEALSAL
ncbi:hypothetical protein [Streptomyces clavifer]|uniref:hypothetical protein n=1 Tax=Streptomyces clavifer TaxID=68188 RepID=UPI0033E31009